MNDQRSYAIISYPKLEEQKYYDSVEFLYSSPGPEEIINYFFAEWSTGNRELDLVIKYFSPERKEWIIEERLPEVDLYYREMKKIGLDIHFDVEQLVDHQDQIEKIQEWFRNRVLTKYPDMI